MSIIDLFLTLERAGPGDAESLRWALDVAQTPADARVLDAGCGIGADTGTLIAAVPRGRVCRAGCGRAFSSMWSQENIPWPRRLSAICARRPPGPMT